MAVIFFQNKIEFLARKIPLTPQGDHYEVRPLRPKSRTVTVRNKAKICQRRNHFARISKKQRFYEEVIEKSREKVEKRRIQKNFGKYLSRMRRKEVRAHISAVLFRSTQYSLGQNRNQGLSYCKLGRTVSRVTPFNSSRNFQFSKTSYVFLAQLL